MKSDLGLRKSLATLVKIVLKPTTCLLLAACHSAGDDMLSIAAQGMPLDRYVESATGVQQFVESRARRYDTSLGARTDIWIAGAAMSDKQKEVFDSKTLDDVDVGQLNSTGVLIRITDDGSRAANAFIICVRGVQGAVTCSPSNFGAVVVSLLRADRVEGGFFTDSRSHDRRFVIPFNAPLSNTSIQPINAVDSWSKDGGEAGVAFMKMIAAAAIKDVDGLRSLSVPKRMHDWDHFGIISSIQRIALQEPRIIASARSESVAHLWVVTTAADGANRMPFQVDMERLGEQWRFAKILF